MKKWLNRAAARALAGIVSLCVILAPVAMPVPAQASQNATACPTVGTLSGLALVQCINNANDTVISNFSGASAPASPTQYQLWADTTNSLLKVYVGSTWLVIGQFSGSQWIAYSGGIKETAPTTTGSANAFVLTYSPAPSALVTGQTYTAVANFTVTGAATLNINSLGAKNVTKNGTAALANGDIVSGQVFSVVYDGTEFQLSSPLANTVTQAIPVRQTVLSGPVDANGYASFGGSTGSTTVTASGTLIATAANGFSASGQVDKVCSITNPSWTGLSTNGTMYLYLDASASTCTVGAGTLAPVYQWGGSYSTTNGQFTYNIQAMSGQVGNGSTAAQANRIYVGQVTVASGTVSAITWYALMGRYDSGLYSVATNTTYALTHNLGMTTMQVIQSIADDAAGTNERTMSLGCFYFNGTANFGAYVGTEGRTAMQIKSTTGGVGLSTSGAGITSAYYRTVVARTW